MTDYPELQPGRGHYAWSLNEEDWPYASFGELLNDDEGVQVGQVVFYGECVKKSPAYFMPSASEVLDVAADKAYDIGGEFAEDFGRDVTQEARRELEDFLSAWASRHLKVEFYQVENVGRHKVTAEDLAAHPIGAS